MNWARVGLGWDEPAAVALPADPISHLSGGGAWPLPLPAPRPEVGASSGPGFAVPGPHGWLAPRGLKVLAGPAEARKDAKYLAPGGRVPGQPEGALQGHLGGVAAPGTGDRGPAGQDPGQRRPGGRTGPGGGDRRPDEARVLGPLGGAHFPDGRG